MDRFSLGPVDLGTVFGLENNVRVGSRTISLLFDNIFEILLLFVIYCLNKAIYPKILVF